MKNGQKKDVPFSYPRLLFPPHLPISPSQTVSVLSPFLMKLPFTLVCAFYALFFVLSRGASISNFLTTGASTQSPYPLTNLHQYQEAAKFSQAAFCDPQPGDTILGTSVHWRAGDGRDVPKIYIAHSPEKGIIISCQGTNKTDKDSIMNVSLNKLRFKFQ